MHDSTCGFDVDGSWKTAGKVCFSYTQSPAFEKYLTSQVFLALRLSIDLTDFSPFISNVSEPESPLFDDYLYTLSPAPTITTKLNKRN